MTIAGIRYIVVCKTFSAADIFVELRFSFEDAWAFKAMSFCIQIHQTPEILTLILRLSVLAFSAFLSMQNDNRIWLSFVPSHYINMTRSIKILFNLNNSFRSTKCGRQVSFFFITPLQHYVNAIYHCLNFRDHLFFR